MCVCVFNQRPANVHDSCSTFNSHSHSMCFICLLIHFVVVVVWVGFVERHGIDCKMKCQFIGTHAKQMHINRGCAHPKNVYESMKHFAQPHFKRCTKNKNHAVDSTRISITAVWFVLNFGD